MSQPLILKMLNANQTTFNAPGNLPLIHELEPEYDQTIPANYIQAIKKFYGDNMLAYRAGLSTSTHELADEYRYITYGDSLKYVQRIVEQLKSLRIMPNDTVCIYAKNSPLWLLADIAVSFCQAITVPIYDTLGVDNIQYCMDFVKTRFVFVGSEVLGNILGMTNSIASLEHIIVLDRFVDESETSVLAQKVFLKLDGSDIQLEDDTKSLFQLSVHSKQAIEEADTDDLHVPEVEKFVTQLFTNGQVSRLHLHTISTDISSASGELELPSGQTPQDPSSIIFTSGTSGRPKAVVSCSSNLYASGCCMGRQLQPYNKADSGIQSSTLSYLPLAHVYERGYEHYCYLRGYCIYYYSGSTKNLTQDIKLSKPTIFIGVPRVFTKIYGSVFSQLQKAGVIPRAIFNTTYLAKKIFMSMFPSSFRTGKVMPFDIIFKKISQNLGGNVEVMITASSALPIDVGNFLRTCTNARLVHGYGSTETSATGLIICSGDRIIDQNSLGKAAYQTSVIIIDRSDVSEFSLNEDKIGEILIKGPGVCLGYFNGDINNLTPIADKDGYYHTGDLGRLNQDGSISFIRRISLVQKLQHGEFVDLEQLESAIESSPLISHCFCYADPSKCAPVCIISCESTMIGTKFTNISNQNQLDKFMMAEIETFVRKAGIKAYCIPKAICVKLDEDWSLNMDLFTPSSKKQHRNFRIKFDYEIQLLLKTIE
ncbi:Long chain fatty acid CoA ligase [Spironucleus salmonicida]|uniref:Long chain fatty acid CoA ligase n=1 Tax=Spironucleus salmonicida TaxID=348837 RepID=A0A9P8S1K9_9EUKA|nr:Long chain fatty acid CoA ligase [Spironucleus salmonicida]